MLRIRGWIQVTNFGENDYFQSLFVFQPPSCKTISESAKQVARTREVRDHSQITYSTFANKWKFLSKIACYLFANKWKLCETKSVGQKITELPSKTPEPAITSHLSQNCMFLVEWKFEQMEFRRLKAYSLE